MIAATPFVVPVGVGHSSRRLMKELRSGGSDVVLSLIGVVSSEAADDEHQKQCKPTRRWQFCNQVDQD
jgi:hypothetical protein